jgi:hypothetical protein
MQIKENKIFGKYILKSHGIFNQAGDFIPTSSYLKGELNYGQDGALSLLIVFSEGPQILKDVLSYVGSYKIISSNQINHLINLSTHQPFNETIETRNYKFNDHELTLSKNLDDGKRFEAVWLKQTLKNEM